MKSMMTSPSFREVATGQVFALSIISLSSTFRSQQQEGFAVRIHLAQCCSEGIACDHCKWLKSPSIQVETTEQVFALSVFPLSSTFRSQQQLGLLGEGFAVRILQHQAALAHTKCLVQPCKENLSTNTLH